MPGDVKVTIPDVAFEFRQSAIISDLPTSAIGVIILASTWSASGTPQKSSAVQRFRPVTEALSPFWLSSRHACSALIGNVLRCCVAHRLGCIMP